jgi:DNA segregation ATPase FtsK/SpoIIIE, S-DNA-T family
VARPRVNIERATDLNREAELIVSTAEQALDERAAQPLSTAQFAEQHELAATLRAAAAQLAPGWLGAPLDAVPPGTPLPTPGQPQATGTEPGACIRIGTAQPLDDATFPAIVPLTANVTVDGDVRDTRVAGLLRSLTLRLIAAHPAGTVRVKTVDGMGSAFGVFQDLVTAGLMSAPVADRDGLRSVLAEVEDWMQEPNRHHALVLMIASFPQFTESSEFARIVKLADLGPSRGLRLIVAGWPPPQLTGSSLGAGWPPPRQSQPATEAPVTAAAPVTAGALLTAAAAAPGTASQPHPAPARANQDGQATSPLPNAVAITLRNPWAILGNPPGATFGSTGTLNAPVYLDPDPPVATIRSVCKQVAAQVSTSGSTLAELLPERPWQEDSAEGLAAVVGQSGDNPLTLRLSDLTPHWLIGGRSGAGKTAFLINVLYGLSTRYGPDQLSLYLLDFKEGVSFTEFTPTPRDPTWIPQARAVGIESDREYGLAVLRELEAEMTARAQRYKDAGVTRFTDLRQRQAEADPDAVPLARIVCVIDEFQVLVQGSDRLARDAVAALESLARKGRSYGIHLILASQTVRGVESLYTKRDSIFGQFPVRVALPGGGDVLDSLNQAANPLGLGEAIVNTAGGLGGPAGASRAHERLVRFPDPHAEPEVLSSLRRKLWERRPDSRPPFVFEGYATQHLPAKLPSSTPPTAYVGRVIDVPLSLAGFRLDAAPGRHLAALGPSEVGADLLDAAARSLAAQHDPGTVHFVLAPLVASVLPLTHRLAEDLRAAGHVVSTGGRLVPPERDAYLFGFGLDGAGTGADPWWGVDLPALLRDGPSRGLHLFGWWRGLRRFLDDTGGPLGREHVAGLVLLNVPTTDSAMLIGDPGLDWQPRANRALLHDRHTGRTDVIVPFVQSGQS